jgi:transcriptional regulator with XRE-family HTH domain
MRETEMTKKPHQDTQLAQYVERRVLELKPRKTQAEIAMQAGYRNQNMITMVKQGSSKAALDRVPALARALECDPAFLMRLALEQAIGQTAAAAVTEIFGEPITANERGWIEAIREASDNSDPRLTSRSQAAINAIFRR